MIHKKHIIENIRSHIPSLLILSSLLLSSCESKPPDYKSTREAKINKEWEAKFKPFQSTLNIKALEKDTRPIFSLIVTDVARNSQAMKHNIEVGDLIATIDNEPIKSIDSLDIQRGEGQNVIEIWNKKRGLCSYNFTPGQLGVFFREKWIPTLAYIQSNERDAKWDEYVLAAAFHWDKDVVFAKRALERAQKAGYTGWFLHALKIAMYMENGESDLAVKCGKAWNRKLPDHAVRPVIGRLFRAAIMDVKFDFAKKLQKEFSGQYIKRFSWDENIIKGRYAAISTKEKKKLSSSSILKYVKRTDLQADMKTFKERSETFLNTIKKGEPYTHLLSAKKHVTFEFIPFTSAPALDLTFRYNLAEPDVTPCCTPHFRVSLLDASTGMDDPLVEIKFYGDYSFSVGMDGYPTMYYYRSALSQKGFINNLKIHLKKPWCEIWLNNKRIFRGLTPRENCQLYPEINIRSISARIYDLIYSEFTPPLQSPVTKVAIAKSKIAEQDVPNPPDDKNAAWFYDLFVGSYLKHGEHSSEWNKEAIDTVSLAARYWGRDADIVEQQEVFDAAKKTVLKGCRDPLILLIHAEMELLSNCNCSPEPFRIFTNLAKQMSSSSLPPIIRFWILNRSIHFGSASRLLLTQERITKESKMAAGLIASILSDKEAPAWFVEDVFPYLAWDRSERYKGALDEFNSYYNAIMAADSTRSLGLVLKGHFYYHYAWFARGGGFAYTVSDEEFDRYGKYLSIAKEALVKAIEIDPSNSKACALLVSVSMETGDSFRQRLDYFQRAIQSNPNNWNAYENMFRTLQPRWGGSARALRSFAESYFEEASKNPASSIRAARILAELHVRYASDRAIASDKKKERTSIKRIYWSTSDAWTDIQRAYELILKKRPHSRLSKSEYAYYASLCHQWEKAHQLFEELGEELVIKPFCCSKTAYKARNKAAGYVAAKIRKKSNYNSAQK